MASSLRSDFLIHLQERGFIHQASDLEGLDAALQEGAPLTGYIGFDCTAPSLHVGSLVQIMLLYWLQQTGHRPLVLIGGGTTRVGDPSGKDESRQLLSPDTITIYKESIARVFSKLLRFGTGPTDAVLVDNSAWLLNLSYVDFLREIGRHFSVNQMIQRDSVRLRLERAHHLSFLEFNYMVLQAYDYIECAKRFSCRLQMGGSDQWGNIVSGIDLGRRLLGQELYGLTTPLLTTAAGAKMGKTAEGAIWLNADLCTPYAYWQFWRNTDDADLGRFLRLFTTLPLEEIARLEILKGAERNSAKKILATQATSLLHGSAAAEEAENAATEFFEKGHLDASVPTVTLQREIWTSQIGLLDLCVAAGLCPSNSAARRHIRAGALRCNGALVSDEKQCITREACDAQNSVLLSLGKKTHLRVIFEKEPST